MGLDNSVPLCFTVPAMNALIRIGNWFFESDACLYIGVIAAAAALVVAFVAK